MFQVSCQFPYQIRNFAEWVLDFIQMTLCCIRQKLEQYRELQLWSNNYATEQLQTLTQPHHRIELFWGHLTKSKCIHFSFKIADVVHCHYGHLLQTGQFPSNLPSIPCYHYHHSRGQSGGLRSRNVSSFLVTLHVRLYHKPSHSVIHTDPLRNKFWINTWITRHHL